MVPLSAGNRSTEHQPCLIRGDRSDASLLPLPAPPRFINALRSQIPQSFPSSLSTPSVPEPVVTLALPRLRWYAPFCELLSPCPRPQYRPRNSESLRSCPHPIIARRRPRCRVATYRAHATFRQSVACLYSRGLNHQEPSVAAVSEAQFSVHEWVGLQPALAAVVIAVGGGVVVDMPDDRPAHEHGPPDPHAGTLVEHGRDLRNRVHPLLRREAPHKRGGQGGDKGGAAQEEHKPFHVLHLTDRRIRDATHRARARVPVVVGRWGPSEG